MARRPACSPRHRHSKMSISPRSYGMASARISTDMQSFLAILRFELGLHLKSGLFAGIACVFFALNLVTQARMGINLGTNELLALNGAWLIFQTQLVLGTLGMIPAMIFAVTAITRDHE